MAVHDYHFITHWRIPGQVQDVYAVLSDAENYPHWWPEVFLEVRKVGGDAYLFDVSSKGRLPYTLRWRARATVACAPSSFTLEAHGDFVGRGIWSLRQDGAEVDVTFDWKVRAHRPLLRCLSYLVKPVLSANHHWAMRRGQISLRRRLAVLERTQSAGREQPYSELLEQPLEVG